MALHSCTHLCRSICTWLTVSLCMDSDVITLSAKRWTQGSFLRFFSKRLFSGFQLGVTTAQITGEHTEGLGFHMVVKQDTVHTVPNLKKEEQEYLIWNLIWTVAKWTLILGYVRRTGWSITKKNGFLLKRSVGLRVLTAKALKLWLLLRKLHSMRQQVFSFNSD